MNQKIQKRIMAVVALLVILGLLAGVVLPYAGSLNY